MNRFWLLFVILSVLVPFQSVYAKERISVRQRISWDTVLKPELHLFVVNRTQNDIPVAVQMGGWLGVSGAAKTECASRPAGSAQERGNQIVLSDVFDLAHSRGVLPAGGWIHRSWLLPSSSGQRPCQVPYRVVGSSGEVLASGTFDIDTEPEPSTYQMPDPEDLTHDALLEEWMPSTPVLRGGHHYVLRVLLSNSGDRTRVLVSDRAIRCSEGANARWVLPSGPLSGESFGPTRLEKGDSHAFVLGIHSTSGDITRCSVEVNLAAASSGGVEFTPLKTLTIPLQPRGLYAGYD